MLRAFDKFKNLVHIDDADKNEYYSCPICNQRLKQNRGQIRIPHFSHIGKISNRSADYAPCTDRWHYCKSEWHLEWQKRFPINCQEVVVSNGKEKHFADVLINNTVIEFQHSPISIVEFYERNDFYNECGYKVVWVFDHIYKYQKEIIQDFKNPELYFWNPARKMFRLLDLKKGEVAVFFQFSNDEEDQYALNQVGYSYDGFSKFYTKKNYSIINFIHSATTGILLQKKTYQQISEEQIVQAQNSGGKTILEIWQSDYNRIIVENLVNNDTRVIYGIKGQINREKGKRNGKIIGKFSARNANGSFTHSDKYVVWNADDPIWKLVQFIERDDKEYIYSKIDDTQNRFNDCLTISQLLLRYVGDKLLVRCILDNSLFAIGILNDGRINAVKYNKETGDWDFSNEEFNLLKNKKIWEFERFIQ